MTKEMVITENISLWDRLKDSAEPIVLYGMGNGADKILNCCEANGIKIHDVFASDEFVRGHSFRGFRVKKFSEMQKTFENFIIVVAFATRNRQVIERIRELDRNYELYAPDMPVFGDSDKNIVDYHDYFLKNINDFSRVYKLLSDEKSRQVYLDVINFRISGKIKYLQNADTPKEEAFSLLRLGEIQNLHYTDLGAYDGDTIIELSEYLKNIGNTIGKIVAVEPDRKNFVKMQRNLSQSNLLERCSLCNIGIWSERKDIYFDEKAGRHSAVSPDGGKINAITADSVDNILNTPKIEKNYRYFVKYDVEGSEYEALKGSSELIKKHSPVLSVSLYHRSEDLTKLPLLINELNPSYKFYLRKHEYIPCWDLNLYASL